MQKSTTKTLALMGMFIGLSAIGAAIKLPSPTGTVAFDSAPGFAAALILGPGYGALAAALGHLFTSLFSGFPMTIPLHLLVAVQMSVAAGVYGLLKQKSFVIAIIAAVLINGIGAPACFILIPGFGMGFFLGMVVPLLVASLANVLVSALIYKYVASSSQSRLSKIDSN